MRYKKEGIAISINLHNDYFIIAITNWNNENKKYYTTFYIKHKTVDILDKLEKFVNIECTTTSAKEINNEVADLIMKEFKTGSFDYYINRYDYEQKCFDRGHELFEDERKK